MASRSLGTLTLDVIAKIGGFAKGMTDAERIADKKSREIAAKQKARAREVQAAWDGIRNSFGGNVLAGAFNELVANLSRIPGAINDLTKEAGKFKDIEDRVGGAAEGIAGFAVAASTAGIEVGAVAEFSVRLTKELSKVEDETEGAGKALKALNIPIKEFKQLDPVAQVERLAKAISGFASGPEQTAALEGLVRGGSQLLPFLKTLEDQGGRINILTREQILLSDEYADRQSRAAAELKLYAQAASTQAIPALTALVDVATDTAKALLGIESAGQSLVASGAVKSFAEDAGRAIARFADYLVTTGKEFSALIAFAEAYAKISKQLLSGEFAAARQTGADFRARFNLDELGRGQKKAGQEAGDTFVAAYNRALNAGLYRGTRLDASSDPRSLTFGQSTKPVIDITGLGEKDGPKKKIKEARDETERYIDSLNKQLERTKELTAVEQVLADIEAGRIKGINAASAGKAIDIAEQIDARKRLEDQLKAEAEQVRELEAIQRQQLGEVERIYESTRTPLERYNAELDRLAKLYREVGIDQVTYFRALGAAKQAFDEATKDTKKQSDETRDAAKDLGLTFASGFEDAIVEGKKLSDVLKSLEQDIIRIVTRKLVTEPLANFVSGAVGGSGGGLFGSLAGLLGFRAQGGPVMAGGAYVVGENGPELFQPDTAGTVIPAPQTQKMLGGSRINIVQNFAPGTDRRTIEQAAAMTGIAVQRAVARQT